MSRLLDTGSIIKGYLLANGKTLDDLSVASGVSARMIYRLFNDECKLSYEVALGVNKLIPEVSVEFLMGYDAKYQIEKRQLSAEYDVNDIDRIIDYFELKKLFPDIKKDKAAMLERGSDMFDYKSLSIETPWLVTANYSSANNALDKEKKLWLTASYYECKKARNNKLEKFNQKVFDKEFKNVLQLCGTTDFNMTLFNIENFSEKCGINFYYRESIPNSRIKAVTVKDKDEYIFVFVSNLFKCVENLWIAFIHECIHISNGDYNTQYQYDDLEVNENYVSVETAKYFAGNSFDEIDDCSLKAVSELSKKEHIPNGIAAEIIRYKTKCYGNRDVNALVHYY